MAYVTLAGADKKREKIGYKCFPFKPTVTENSEWVLTSIMTQPTAQSAAAISFVGGQFMDRNVTANGGPRGPESLS